MVSIYLIFWTFAGIVFLEIEWYWEYIILYDKNISLNYSYTFSTLNIILQIMSSGNLPDIRSVRLKKSYSLRISCVDGQCTKTCSSVWISPQEHKRSSTGNRPLPLLFHLPVSTANEWLETRKRVKAILWYSVILCLLL